MFLSDLSSSRRFPRHRAVIASRCYPVCRIGWFMAWKLCVGTRSRSLRIAQPRPKSSGFEQPGTFMHLQR